MSKGWIKLHRELMDKPIWEGSTPEQKVILITLLAMANHKEKEWEFQGERYKAAPGQFVTSLESIVKKAGNGVTIQNVRTALKRFEKYDFLTNVSTNKNRLITLVNWEVYQHQDDEPNKQDNKQLTSNQQATNKQLTTNKNERIKEDKNIVHQEELFEQWWNLYDNKKGKVKCLTKYKSLLKKHSHESMMNGTQRYIQHRKNLANRKEFLPQQKNPLTFLNGEHFNDEYNEAPSYQARTTPTYKPVEFDYTKGES